MKKMLLKYLNLLTLLNRKNDFEMRDDDEVEALENKKSKQSKIRYIKKTARNLVRDSKSCIPIQINQIVRHLIDSRCFEIYSQAIDLKPSFSGQIIRKENIVGVIYNKNHHVFRQRFTFAHELGHLVLEHDIKVKKYKEIINLQTKSPMEQEANIFAAELLMPKDLLKEHIKNNSIKDVKQLSRSFQVSEDAMWFKINSDNLIRLI